MQSASVGAAVAVGYRKSGNVGSRYGISMVYWSVGGMKCCSVAKVPEVVNDFAIFCIYNMMIKLNVFRNAVATRI